MRTRAMTWRLPLLALLFLNACASVPGDTSQHGRHLHAIPPYKPGPNYAYFLNLEQRERGLGYLGSRKRLKTVISKFLDGETVHVTTVGGSVTAGLHGVGDGHSWPEYLFNFLNSAFPGQLQSTNGAVPGTISSYMAACVNIHVPKTTDLVLVEYTVNDIHHAMPLFMNEYRRAYERLLRKLLAYPNKPAVVLMHSYNWMAPPIGKFWSNLEREYQEFAWYYDLPSLSLKSASFHSLVQGDEGFQVLQPRHDDVNGLAGKSFYFDKIHPDALTGARAMAELAMHLVVVVKRELEASKAGADGEDGPAAASGLSDIPPPMIPGNHETLTDKCFIGSHFQKTIASASGFEWLNDSRGKAPKYGFIAMVPGSVLRVKVDTRATSSGAASAPGTSPAASVPGNSPAKAQVKPSDKAPAEKDEEEDAEEGGEAESESGSSRALQKTESKARPVDRLADHVLVQIVYLKSYEGMGSASVACESGCQCRESVIEGMDASQHNSQLYVHSIYVSQSQECIIAIKVRPGPTGRSKVKISGVIVSEETGEIKGAAKTVEAVELVHTISLQTGGSFDVRTKTVGGRAGAG